VSPDSPGSFAPLVSILTGGGDKPYALGISSALSQSGVDFDFIGSDDLAVSELLSNPHCNFLNLRGDMRSHSSAFKKLLRVLAYYFRLLRYAATSRAPVFHLLWNNKFEFFDRTLLLLYYRLFGKRLVFTAHNVNSGKRDGNDSWLNRLSLRIQYSLVHHIFVHTEKMRDELLTDFSVPDNKVTVIPFGINNTLRDSSLTPAQARTQLGLDPEDRVILFFGNILPYKGLEYLIAALSALHPSFPCKLLIVGRAKSQDPYWSGIETAIAESPARDHILKHCRFVPDEEVELYTKASDVLVLPYTHIFQSGVLFVGYSFGLPVIAADVGSLKEEIVDGKTGFTFNPRDSSHLVEIIRKYFSSDLYQNLERNRLAIRAYANERYSWTKVANLTTEVYSRILS
jgi:glycosyltransferase involved in cell wall biosynthesis